MVKMNIDSFFKVRCASLSALTGKVKGYEKFFLFFH